KAYNLMKHSKKKVVEVYAEVGFRNPSHFSTAFKKHFGVAPSAVTV
ncbi:AraC family transcriptional regulator, partial [uncultured Duncaniella sp.]